MRVRALRQGETLQVNASVLSSLVECEKGSKGDGGNAAPSVGQGTAEMVRAEQEMMRSGNASASADNVHPVAEKLGPGRNEWCESARSPAGVSRPLPQGENPLTSPTQGRASLRRWYITNT